MTEFKFVDAPPPGEIGRNSMYREFAEALRDRPGEWAIWPREFKNKQTACACVSNIRRGDRGIFKDGFEAVARGVTVYVRFVGGES